MWILSLKITVYCHRFPFIGEFIRHCDYMWIISLKITAYCHRSPFTGDWQLHVHLTIFLDRCLMSPETMVHFLLWYRYHMVTSHPLACRRPIVRSATHGQACHKELQHQFCQMKAMLIREWALLVLVCCSSKSRPADGYDRHSIAQHIPRQYCLWKRITVMCK